MFGPLKPLAGGNIPLWPQFHVDGTPELTRPGKIGSCLLSNLHLFLTLKIFPGFTSFHFRFSRRQKLALCDITKLGYSYWVIVGMYRWHDQN